MQFSEAIIEDINNACSSTAVENTHAVLLQKIKQICPDLVFSYALTRTGWYRTGGLFNPEGERITHNLREWLETENDGDLDVLFDQYADAGLVVSTLVGKTHYFVVPTGDAAEDFVQLEVEELQEVMDHVLFSNDMLPDDIEDIVDPVDVAKVAAKPVDKPRYIFRRVTAIADYIKDLPQKMAERGNKSPIIQRFMQDWQRCSAKDSGPFCQHWVLSLQQYNDSYGEPVKQIKPINTFINRLPDIKIDKDIHGIELANLINNFDRVAGYPMAWFFFMLTHREIPYSLAAVIYQDLMEDYDYLPAKDLKVLEDWSIQPYGV